MSGVDPSSVVIRLAELGYNVDPEAAKLLASASDPSKAIEQTVDSVPTEVLRITANDLPAEFGDENPLISTGNQQQAQGSTVTVPPETMGERSPVDVANDITGKSTGTGEYADFISLFRDRYERLSAELRGRVTHRSARSIEAARGGTEVGMIGMISDIRQTRNGHWMIELEDSTGVFPALVLADREEAETVPYLVTDEVIGVTGRLSDDGGILFTESIHFPDIPRTFRPHTASRPVEAALISDVHVGSKEFLADAWDEFAAWLHSAEAEHVEYLLIAGDMVEGVGVYPNQDEDLAIIDLYDQYERFAEVLKAVPGSLEIVMIPGNHDAVRLAEPQPAFEDDLADIMAVHDATVVSNPSVVTIESVRFLMYHGASLDELIASIPVEDVSYDQPHRVMQELLRKRHLAPPFGGGVRIAPEKSDYLVIDEVPDVFHTGHVHKIGIGEYNGVRLVNSGCWQAQTDFQRRNNLQPDPGYAPIIDLQTLDVTLRKFH